MERGTLMVEEIKELKTMNEWAEAFPIINQLRTE